MRKLLSISKLDYLFLFIGIVFTAALSILNFNVPFIYDDFDQVLNNPYIRDFFDWPAIAKDPIRSSRFIQNLSFAFNWMIAGDSLWSFHLFNNFLHLINTFLIFKLLHKVGIKNNFVLFVTCILFLIHPLQLESVTYVMGRVELLKTLSTLILLHMYLREKISHLRIYLVFSLSLLIKETCCLTLGLFVFLDLYIRSLSFKELPYKRYFFYATHLLFLIPIRKIFNFDIHTGVVGFDIYPFSSYLISNLYYLPYYISLYFNPSEQSIYHEWISEPPLAGTLLGVGIYLMMVITFIKGYRQKSVIAFMFGVFLISFLPTSSILQFINPFAEYRLYQSNLVVSFLFCLGLDSLLKSSKLKSCLSIILISYFLFFHYLYLQQWESPVKTWQYAKEKYPSSPFININLASMFLKKGHCIEGLKYLTEGCKKKTTKYLESLCHEVLLYGHLVNGDTKNALVHAKLAYLTFRHKTPAFYMDYLIVAYSAGETELVTKLYEEALKTYPEIFKNRKKPSAENIKPISNACKDKTQSSL